MNEIVKISSDHKILYNLEGGSDEVGSFYYANDIAIDRFQNLYILNYVADTSGLRINREEILRFDPVGRFHSVVYQQSYLDLDYLERPIRTGKITSLQYMDGKVYFGLNNGDDAILMGYDAQLGKLSEVERISFPNAGFFCLKMQYIPSKETVIYTSKKSEIYKYENGTLTLLYAASPTDNGISIPWRTVLDHSGNLYFADLGLNRISSLSLDGDAQVIFSREHYENHIPFLYIDEIKSSETDGKTILSFAYDGYIIKIDAAGQIVCLENTFSYPKNEIAMRFFTWFCGLGLLIYSGKCLLAFITKKIKDRSVTTIGVIIASVVITIAFTTYLVSNYVTGDFNTRYVNAELDSMKVLASYIASNIDPEAVESLQSPAHFWNEAYLDIRETIHDGVNSTTKVGKQFYGALFTVVNDQLYTLMQYDDYVGPYHPIAEPYFDTTYEEAFRFGKLVGDASIDPSGSWLYADAPIYNKNGKIIAVFEVGTDMYAFSAENARMLKALLLDMLTLIVVIVFIIIEIALLSNYILSRKKQPPDENPLAGQHVFIRPVSFFLYMSATIAASFTPILMMSMYSGKAGVAREVTGGFPLAAEAVASAFALFAGGIVIKRLGWKPTFIVGAALILTGNIISALTTYDIGFVLARFIAGAGVGFTLYSIQMFALYSTNTESEDRIQSIVSLNSGVLAGTAVGVVIGGMLANRIGMQNVFYVSIVFTALAVLLVLLFCSNNNLAAAGEESRQKQSIRDLLQFITNREALIYLLVYFLPISLTIPFLNYLLPVFSESSDMAISDISRAFLLNSVCIVYLGKFTSTLTSKYLGDAKSLVLALGLAGLALLFFSAYPTVETAFLAAILLGIGDSFGITSQVNYFTGLKASVRIGEETAMSVYGLFESFTVTIGPLVYGFLISYGISFGVSVVSFIILGGMAILGAQFIFGSISESRRNAKLSQ